jgi:hypothetical protein
VGHGLRRYRDDRYTALATGTQAGPHARIDTRHRVHAWAEDHSEAGCRDLWRGSWLGSWPETETPRDLLWLERRQLVGAASRLSVAVPESTTSRLEPSPGGRRRLYSAESNFDVINHDSVRRLVVAGMGDLVDPQLYRDEGRGRAAHDLDVRVGPRP